MIIYIEYPKKYTENLLELTNELTKVAQYKLNIQKSIAFLIHLQRTI